MKAIVGMLILFMACTVLSPASARAQQASSNPGDQAKQSAAAESSKDALLYRNDKYGFTFSLPAEWKGYTIVTEQWEASDAQKGMVEHGPIIKIRPPDWTKEKPR